MYKPSHTFFCQNVWLILRLICQKITPIIILLSFILGFAIAIACVIVFLLIFGAIFALWWFKIRFVFENDISDRAIIHCAKLIPGHDNTYIRNRFSLRAPLNIIFNIVRDLRLSPTSIGTQKELGSRNK